MSKCLLLLFSVLLCALMVDFKPGVTINYDHHREHRETQSEGNAILYPVTVLKVGFCFVSVALRVLSG
jgi:hypothetical protein